MDKLETALMATGYAWAHYAWSHAPEGDFGTWGEEGANILRADDRSNLRATRYSIHYFTRDASPTPREAIEAALDGIPCAWSLDYLDFEEDTGYIHYEWVAEVI